MINQVESSVRQLQNATHGEAIHELGKWMALHGYTQVQTPIIDEAELFLTKAGDQIIQRLFTFERHGKELALRPEFTAPAAHHYVTAQKAQGVARWQFSGPVFEDAPHNLSLNFQRASVGAELIGMFGPHADAEIIAMAVGGLQIFDIANWQLFIGHTGLTRQLLARFALDSRTQQFLLSHLPTLKEQGKAGFLEQLGVLLPEQNGQMLAAQSSSQDTAIRQLLGWLLKDSEPGTRTGGRTPEDIARRLWQKHQRVASRSTLADALGFLEQWAAIQASPEQAFALVDRFTEVDESARMMVDEWRVLTDLLAIYEVPLSRVKLEPALARHWEYYTGVVFELRSGNGLHLAGGGRYDELARLIGGERDIPAVGFAYDTDSVLSITNRKETGQRIVLSIILKADNDIAAAHWARNLRARGLTTILKPFSDTLDADQIVLQVEADGSAWFGQKLYTIAQVDELVTGLSETSYDS